MTRADPTRQVRGERRRQAILEAALRLISQHGVGALTHRAVAEEADVPLASTTYYFDSLDELLDGALHLFVDEEATRLTALAERLEGTGPAPGGDRAAVPGGARARRRAVRALRRGRPEAEPPRGGPAEHRDVRAGGRDGAARGRPRRARHRPARVRRVYSTATGSTGSPAVTIRGSRTRCWRSGRPRRARSARGTASSSRSRARPCWKNAIESGSPPCSPQMPSFRSGLRLHGRSTRPAAPASRRRACRSSRTGCGRGSCVSM